MVAPTAPDRPAASPHRSQTEDEREAEVGERRGGAAGLQQGQGLVAEGGHRREPAAQPGSEQDARVGADQSALQRHGHHQSEDEAAQDIDRQRPNGKVVPFALCTQPASQ
jgi:hypothetical protein